LVWVWVEAEEISWDRGTVGVGSIGSIGNGYSCQPIRKTEPLEKKGATVMPRGDRTGPLGMGPRAGRGAGYCVGTGKPGFDTAEGGGFFGNFWGPGPAPRSGGRGFCRWFFGAGLPAWNRFAGWWASAAESAPDLEKQSLKGQAEALQGELDRIKKRIQEMEAGEVPG
jgi:hypothetical protein